MNEREKIAHLLRRYGLGAGKYEVDRYAPLGVEGTLERLLNFENVDEKFATQPYEFTVYEAGLQVDPPKFASWWALRLLQTQTPLREKLTVFWHDHFAVSATKVFDGPSMLTYLETLRRNAAGDFGKMVHEVSREPAMIFYLDTQTNTRRKPNENFARELLELFTMGSGYTEIDIREAARCFCGWGILYSGFGDDRPFEKQVEEAARNRESVIAFCEAPAHRDTGVKKVLGKEGDLRASEVIDLALRRPETARHVTGKLAKWFMGIEPSKALNEKLANLFAKDFQIKPVLRELAHADEFWSPRTQVKSPVDFSGAFFRQLNLNDILLQMRPADKDPWVAMRPELRGAGEGLLFLMSQQGLLLFYPPNVGGWEWGKAWLSASNVTSRVNLARQILVGDDPNRPIGSWLAARITADFKPTNDTELVDAFLAIFDGEFLDKEQRSLMAAAAVRMGGPGALSDKEKGSQLLAELGKMLFAVPDFQLC